MLHFHFSFTIDSFWSHGVLPNNIQNFAPTMAVSKWLSNWELSFKWNILSEEYPIHQQPPWPITSYKSGASTTCIWGMSYTSTAPWPITSYKSGASTTCIWGMSYTSTAPWPITSYKSGASTTCIWGMSYISTTPWPITSYKSGASTTCIWGMSYISTTPWSITSYKSGASTTCICNDNNKILQARFYRSWVSKGYLI